MRALTLSMATVLGLTALSGCDESASEPADPWFGFSPRAERPEDAPEAERPGDRLLPADSRAARQLLTAAALPNGGAEALVRDGRAVFDGDTRRLDGVSGAAAPVSAAGAGREKLAAFSTTDSRRRSLYPEPPSPVKPDLSGADLSPEPKTPLDKLFYSYGTACFGMDWRFLKAVARAESGLDPRNRTGRYVGLFQLEPEQDKDHTCGMYIKPFKGYLSCRNLEDPETNIAIAAHRFNRHFKAERNFAPDSTYISMIEACPDADVEALTALAYVGHNNGPGVLKYILRRIKRNGACELRNQEAAVRSFYSNPRIGNVNGWYENPKPGHKPRLCARAKALKGHWSYHCISENYGARKWRYGVNRVASVVKKSGVTTLYPDGARDPAACPALQGSLTASLD